MQISKSFILAIMVNLAVSRIFAMELDDVERERETADISAMELDDMELDDVERERETADRILWQADSQIRERRLAFAEKHGLLTENDAAIILSGILKKNRRNNSCSTNAACGYTMIVCGCVLFCNYLKDYFLQGN